jgi:hypothetical protein
MEAIKEIKSVQKENIEELKQKYLSQLSFQQLKIIENAKDIFTNFELERSNGFLKWLDNNNINRL